MQTYAISLSFRSCLAHFWRIALIGSLVFFGFTQAFAQSKPTWRDKGAIAQGRYAHSEVGVASWYGPGFHGRRTASGEIFNQNALTAAHRTLPLGSVTRVTNLHNGKQIQVEITDRGPYVPGRTLDLSRAAAEKLGMKHAGLAEVRIETRLNPRVQAME